MSNDQNLENLLKRVRFTAPLKNRLKAKSCYARYPRQGFLYSKILTRVYNYDKPWRFLSAETNFGSHVLRNTFINFPARTPQGRFVNRSKYAKIRWFRSRRAYQNTLPYSRKIKLLKQFGGFKGPELNIFRSAQQLFTLTSEAETRALGESYLLDSLKTSTLPKLKSLPRLTNFFDNPIDKLLDSYSHIRRIQSVFATSVSSPTVRPEFRKYIPTALGLKYRRLPLSVSPDLLELYFTTVSRLQTRIGRVSTLMVLNSTKVPSFWARFYSGYFSLFQNSQVVGLGSLLRGTRLRYFSEALYILRFRFNRERLTIVLSDEISNKTYCFLTPGLLVKFAQNRKSLRKKTSMKILMMQFLRKLLIVLRLNKIQLVSSGVPVLLSRLLYVLSQPLNHLVKNPLTGSVIDEITQPRTKLNFDSVFFTRAYPYGYLPTRKRGRVKRKIRRKLVKLGRLID